MKHGTPVFFVLGLAALATGWSCAKPKQIATVPAPPPPPVVSRSPATPQIETFGSDLTVVTAGASTTLRWAVRDATEIRIEPGIGGVASKGEQLVSPTENTSYKLVARGPGGEVSAVASVSVVAPAERPKPLVKSLSMVEVREQLQDIYFNVDTTTLSDNARQTLEQNAILLRKFLAEESLPVIVRIEGHADERGSTEYNYGIAAQRAHMAMEYLVSLGVAASKLDPVPYGKEMPVCTESTEECWQRNRRVHLSPIDQKR